MRVSSITRRDDSRKPTGERDASLTDRLIGLVGRQPLLWISVAALPVFLLGLSTPGLNQSEAMYAEIAREMRSSADWITPHLNGARHLDKPPLLYWLIALAQGALGESEFSARLWPALAAWGTVPITGAIGIALFGQRAGLAAAFVFATSLGPFIFGRMSLPDPSMTFWISLAILGYVRGFVQEDCSARSPWPWVMFAAIGFASLIKGLVGAGLPAVIIGIHAIWSGRLQAFLSPRLLLWIGLTAAVAVPWYWAACRANPEFFGYFFLREHLERFTGQRYPADEFLSLPVFLTLTIMWTFPWAAVVPLGIWHGLKRAVQSGWRKAPEVLPLLWIGIVVGLFSASRSRLEYYAFPALPGVCIMVGRLWDSLFDRGREHPGPRSATLSVGLMATLACFAAAASFILLGPGKYLIFEAIASSWPGSDLAPGPEQTDVLSLIRWPTLFSLGWIAVLTTGATISLREALHKRAFVLLGLMAVPLFVMVHWGFLVMEPFMSLRSAAEHAAHHTGHSGVIVSREPHEYMWIGGLPYYSGRMVHILKDPRYDDAPSKRREPPERFLDSRGFADLWMSERRVVLIVDRKDPILPELQASGRYDLLAETGGRTVVGNSNHSTNSSKRADP